MMDYNKIWESVLDKIKEITTQISFETWFLPLKIRRIDQDLNIVYIEVNSDNRSRVHNNYYKKPLSFNAGDLF